MRIALTALLLSASTSAWAALPDLRFETVEGVHDVINQEIEFKIRVRNNNTVPSNTTFVDVYTDPDDGDWTDCDGEHLWAVLPSLAPGAFTTVTFTLSDEDASGPVYFFVDLNNFNNETNEANNEGVALFLPNGLPRVTTANLSFPNPPCLAAEILADFGIALAPMPVMFYAKLRIM